MTRISWLHLSDWHQTVNGFGRSVVRDALLDDLADRTALDENLDEIDFVVFSGDLASKGHADELSAARGEFLDPVLARVEVDRQRLFLVPGNHDVDRDAFELLPKALLAPFSDESAVEKWLTDDERRDLVLRPTRAYSELAAEFGFDGNPAYAAHGHLNVRGVEVGLVGLNSALMAGRDPGPRTPGRDEDYGLLVVGEPQAREALRHTEGADVQIAVVHHPIDWLQSFDRNRLEPALASTAHFLLHGHRHLAHCDKVRGTSGDHVVIPAGASFTERSASDQRFANAYTLVTLDLERGTGVAYLRRWGDRRNKWIADEDTTPGGASSFVLPAALCVSPPTSPGRGESSGRRQQGQDDRTDLAHTRYLRAVVKDNAELEPRGVSQAREGQALPLEEIYLQLSAVADKPDVDRRVMQEEFEEVGRQLDLIEDPAEREREFERWAQQATLLHKTLDMTVPSQRLHDIAREQRAAVILGDPGSGKTTLLRYVALTFAQAILANPGAVLDPTDPWDPGSATQAGDLGTVRLPILVRVSEFAEARRGNPQLSLVDFLTDYFTGLQIPDAHELAPLFHTLLDAGRCIVLLDGLDEIPDPAERIAVAMAVRRFIAAYSEKGIPVDASSPRAGPQHLRSLLTDARVIHTGNHFLVTSRIAGYHIAPVGGVELFTIRDLEQPQIEEFLGRWCHAVARHAPLGRETGAAEERARREVAGVLRAIAESPGVRRLASNPLLLRILATVHQTKGHLPQRRVQLYETAALTLLQDWNLAKGDAGTAIDEDEAVRLLGPLAFHMHEAHVTPFVTLAEARRLLARERARQSGEEPEKPSARTEREVNELLERVRQHAGLFLERGEGLYGFMHLTFQEYFAARELTSSARTAKRLILKRLHEPRWREPILLAVGILSRQFYDDTREVLLAIRDAPAEHEDLLHRNLLFVAHCIGDCVAAPDALVRDVAGRLLELWSDRTGSGRYKLLQRQVRAALELLAGEGRGAVDEALAESLRRCAANGGACPPVDLVEPLSARGAPVAPTLQAAVGQADACVHELIDRLVALRFAQSPSTRIHDAMLREPAFARLVGLLRVSGWEHRIALLLRAAGDFEDENASELAFLMTAADSVDEIRMAVALARSSARASFANVFLARMYKSAPPDAELKAALDDVSNALTLPGRDRAEVARVDDAVGGLEEAARRVREEVLRRPAADTVERLGRPMLDAARPVSAVVPHLAAVGALLLGSGEAPPPSALDAKHAIVARLHKALAATGDPLEYHDITAFLLSLQDEGREGVVDASAVAASLVRDATRSGARQRVALATMCSEEVQSHVQLTHDQRYALLSAEGPEGTAIARLQASVHGTLDGRSLRVCFDLLCRSDAALHETLLSRLGTARAQGSRAGLGVLEGALDDAAVRPVALDLMKRIEWVDGETLAWTLAAVESDDFEMRAHAAVLLARQEHVYHEVRLALLQPPASPGVTGDGDSWRQLANETTVVRLLALLMTNGWHDALSYALTGHAAGHKDVIARGHEFKRALRIERDAEERIRRALRYDQHVLTRRHHATLVAALRGAAEAAGLRDTTGWQNPEIVQRAESALVANIRRTPHLIGILPLGELRRLAQERTGRVADWVATAVASAGGGDASASGLAALLRAPSAAVRRGAALSLVAEDLHAKVMPVLAEAMDIADDRLRRSARDAFMSLGTQLSGYNESAAVDWLRSRDYDELPGYASGAFAAALGDVYCVRPQRLEQQLSDDRIKFDSMSPALVPLLRRHLSEASGSAAEEGHSVLAAICTTNSAPYEPGFHRVPLDLMDSTDSDARALGAYTLRWSADDDAAEAIARLLASAETSDDESLVAAALGSVGTLAARAPKGGDSHTVETLRKFARRDAERVAAAARMAIGRIELARDVAPADMTVGTTEQVLAAALGGVTTAQSGSKPRVVEVSKAVAGWVTGNEEASAQPSIDLLLDWLDESLRNRPDEGPTGGERAAGIVQREFGWPFRCAVACTLAELSERLTWRSFTAKRDLVDVIDLLTDAGSDRMSWFVRQQAIRALGNLQLLTPEVVSVLFDACRDSSEVYAQARTAVTNFRRFSPQTLARLSRATADESVMVAEHTARLLGALGTSRSEELGAKGRKEIARELVKVLGSPHCERAVYNASGAKTGQLFDVVFEALVRVVDPSVMIHSRPAPGGFEGLPLGLR